MKNALKQKVAEIKEEVSDLGGSFSVQETGNKDAVILYNRDPGKVIFMGIFPSGDGFKAYSVDINKWVWAETEGFSRDDIIEKLRNDIFLPIEMKELPKSLL